MCCASCAILGELLDSLCAFSQDVGADSEEDDKRPHQKAEQRPEDAVHHHTRVLGLFPNHVIRPAEHKAQS